MDETPPDLTHDTFLGGQLRIWQPAKGYRAGVDPVLLAASVPARAGQSVLELGCGAGVASLALARRVGPLDLTGLEVQPLYADLARRNAAEAGIAMQVILGDLAEMPAELRQRRFHHVIANPPYFRRDQGTAAPLEVRERAMGEATPLATWVQAAAKRVVPGGTVTFIQRAERLPDLLALMMVHVGAVQVLPLIPRPGRDAQLVLLRARKGGRAAFRLHAGVLMHGDPTHPGDRENYTDQVRAVLRDGAELSFPA